jgi:hypothetical protein
MEASITYSKVSDGLDQALSEINDSVAAVDTKAWLYRTKQIQKYVIQLYIQIFHFLTEAMEWYTKNSRRRLRLSFNQNLYSDLIAIVNKIKDTTKLISDEVQGYQSAEIRAIRLNHEKEMQMLGMYLSANMQEKREIKQLMEKLNESLQRIAEAKSMESQQENKSDILLQILKRLQDGNFSIEHRVQNEMLVQPAKRILGGIAKTHVQAESSRHSTWNTGKSRYPMTFHPDLAWSNEEFNRSNSFSCSI